MSLFVFCWCEKTLTKIKLEIKGVYFILQVIVCHQLRSISELSAGTWRLEPRQRPWRNAVGWLASHPSYITLAHLPRNGIAPNGLGPPSLHRNFKNASQTLPKANPSKNFLN